ncbi:hypothetical protein BLA29_009320 [Euroglyphus maynei]|uniref:Uncharacterized protein n=1 Tax=Euroglyphus maynei TaxID=6958 RepID=A0A1Y3ARJ8_EURMA|nr:hypothetical protein BLA29_009320 [Euroglyphus maynei]
MLQQSYHIRKNHRITLTITKSNNMDTIEELAESCRKQQIIPLTLDNSYVYRAIRHHNPQSHIYTISEYIKFISRYEDGVNMIIQSDSFALIEARMRLELSQTFLGPDQLFLPLEGHDSTILTVVGSIPTSFTFEYQKEFNQDSPYTKQRYPETYTSARIFTN